MDRRSFLALSALSAASALSACAAGSAAPSDAPALKEDPPETPLPPEPEHPVRIDVGGGMGYVSYAYGEDEPAFDPEFRCQSAVVSGDPGTTLAIAAQPEEGWEFVRWSKDGEGMDAPARTSVVIDGPASYEAWFEPSS